MEDRARELVSMYVVTLLHRDYEEYIETLQHDQKTYVNWDDVPEPLKNEYDKLRKETHLMFRGK